MGRSQEVFSNLFHLHKTEINYCSQTPNLYYAKEKSAGAKAEVFYNVKNGSSFIKAKICQRISVMKINTLEN